MPNINVEQPNVEDTDLAAYLVRMFVSIQGAFLNTAQLDKLTVEPENPQVGKLYYFSATTTNITAIGYWGYKDTGWVQLG